MKKAIAAALACALPASAWAHGVPPPWLGLVSLAVLVIFGAIVGWICAWSSVDRKRGILWSCAAWGIFLILAFIVTAREGGMSQSSILEVLAGYLFAWFAFLLPYVAGYFGAYWIHART